MTDPADLGNGAAERGVNAWRMADWACVAGPFLLYFAHSLLFRRWIVDDAGITFAYARNLAAGYGSVSQPGVPPVEGYSNFLWLLTLTPFFLLKAFHPVLVPKAVSAALVFLSFVLIHKTAGRFSRSPRTISALALTFLSITTPFVVWTASGLENALYFALICGLLHCCAALDSPRSVRAPGALLAGALAAGIALTRPEGVLYFPLYPLFVLCQCAMRGETERRSALRAACVSVALFCVALGVLFGGHLLFRLAYFHDWAPNTYYAKNASTEWYLVEILWLSAPMQEKFLGGVAAVAGPFAPHVVALLAGATVWLAAIRRLPMSLLAVLAFLAVASAAYLLLPMDWMKEFRFATPMFGLLYLFAFGAGDALLAAVRERQPRATFLSSLAAVLLFAGAARAFYPRSSEFAVQPTLPFDSVCEQGGRRFNDWARRLDLKDASVLLPDLGGALYCGELRVYDLAGLCDKAVARTLLRDPKAFYNYVFETIRPTFIRAHGPWTYYADFRADPRFVRDYAPIREWTDAWVEKNVGRAMKAGEYVRRDAAAGKEAEFALISQQAASGQDGVSM